MKPARLFRPLDFNDQLFKDRYLSSSGVHSPKLFLDSQLQPHVQIIPLHKQFATALVQSVEVKPSWESNQKAANSDFGAMRVSPFPIPKKAD